MCGILLDMRASKMALDSSIYAAESYPWFPLTVMREIKKLKICRQLPVDT